MKLLIELEQEEDGRWIAEVPDLPGVVAYGQTREDALARVQALALRVLAERLEHGEAAPELLSVSFRAA
ncbi:MAG: type II toxin-antitoxin system HicB family antitoxin [Nitrospirae bacterium]|nr:type II toxin-antitoxin system HicB family antitoxin [Nitrospirota bacterium]